MRDGAARYAGLGLSCIFLCGARCEHAAHTRGGHPAGMSGKLPLRGNWQRAGYRDADALLREHEDGCNLGVLCGLQDGAPVSVACVDGDGPAALAWMRQNLPPTPVRDLTQRGEHWYYRAAVPVANRNFRHTTPSIDMEVLGNGRQVVVPPSVHRSGHVYAEAEPWTAEALAAMPVFDPAWFAGFALGGRGAAPPDRAQGAQQGASGATPGPALPPHPLGGSWPGQRAFSRGDYEESFERLLSYLSSPSTPACVSGRAAHDHLMRVAVTTLRGWPLAGQDRLALLAPGECVPVDAADAMREALRVLTERFNPRCVDSDGETPYPWSQDELWHKVRSAASASRLPGPDYWAFDDPDRRAVYARKSGRGAMAPAPSADETSVTDGSDESADDRGGGKRVGQEVDWCRDDKLSDGAAPAWSGVPDAVGDGESAEHYAAEALALVGDAAFPGLGDEGEPADPWLTQPELEPDDEPVDIEVTHHVSRMTEQAMAALARHPNVYSFQGRLCVKARNHDPSLPPVLYVAKRGNLVECLSLESLVRWYQDVTDRKTDEVYRAPERPDPLVVKCVHERPIWRGVRQVRATVSTPVLAPGGRILQRPGYDRETGLLYEPPPGEPFLPVSPRPSRGDCLAALGALLDVVRDFPFDDRRKACGAWLSAVLTRFCRYAYTGNTPLFAVSATMASSGKGKLRDAAAIIADGVLSSVTSFDPESEGEVERKIGMEILDGARHVCIDNIPEGVKLASATLDAMLTSPKFSTRRVGTSEKIHASFADSIGWATGNNLQVGGDLWRRVVEMTIADRSGHPEDRVTDRPELEEWCRRNRRRLVHAALTLVSGWCAAGSPRADIPVMASFEGWGLVRQVVVWCGLTDPFQSRGRPDDDDDVAVRANLFAALRTAVGDGPFTAGQLSDEVSADAGRKKNRRLCELLRQAGVKSGEDSLGRYLASKHRNKSVKMASGEVWTLHYGRTGSARSYRVVVEGAATADDGAKKTSKRGGK